MWSKEFKGLDSPSAQIKRLKSILTELGMSGRMSLEQAKAIKMKREFAQELEDIQDFEKKVVGRHEGRSSREKPGATKGGESSDEEENDEDDGDDSDESKPRKKRIVCILFSGSIRAAEDVASPCRTPETASMLSSRTKAMRISCTTSP